MVRPAPRGRCGRTQGRGGKAGDTFLADAIPAAGPAVPQPPVRLRRHQPFAVTVAAAAPRQRLLSGAIRALASPGGMVGLLLWSARGLAIGAATGSPVTFHLPASGRPRPLLTPHCVPVT